MAKRQVLKITPVLITLNVLVLLFIMGFYLFRLVKYYRLENKPNENGTVLLVDEIKKKQSYLDETKGLVYNEETKMYKYKGDVNDNYISYSGQLFRIISIDENFSIKAISENNVTLLYPGFENGYTKSYVNKWLNESDEKYSGVYEKSLINNKSLLEETLFCEDSIDDLTNITCDKVNKDNRITMLSLYDYKEAGGKDSFLNTGESYNLGSLNGENLNYFVTDEGEISLNQKSSRAITVKPVVTFVGQTELLGGNGKKNNPYIIEKHDIKTAGDMYVGNYAKIDNYTYRVVEVLEDKVKLALDGVLNESEEKKVELAFGGSNSAYTTSNTVGKYLNKTFLDKLSIKDKVVSSDWYIATISLAKMDYTVVKSSKVNAKVGMLTLGDMYIQEVGNAFTILRGMEATNMINVINENGNFFADTISAKYNIRPAFYIKYDTNVASGNGTKEDPFVLGGNDAKETKEE